MGERRKDGSKWKERGYGQREMLAFSTSEVRWFRVTWPEYGQGKREDCSAVEAMVPGDEADKELTRQGGDGSPMICCPLLKVKGGIINLQSTQE